MRFRKSVRICKGVRINFSKSGISTSFGMKGLSMNIGSKGASMNLGIPGTGLYDRINLTGGGKNSKSSMSGRKTIGTTYTVTETINLRLEDNGNILFYDSLNNIICDERKIRAIKKTPEFKSERERMMRVRFDEINKESEKFVNIYQLAPKVLKETEYYDMMEKVILKKYKKETYMEPKPTENWVRDGLRREAKEKIRTWKFWRVGKDREAYVNACFDSYYEEIKNKWERGKALFEQNQNEKEKKINEQYLQEYNAEIESINMALEGDAGYIEKEIEGWLRSVTLPVEFDLQFEYEEGMLYVDLDLPEIEDLPQEKAVMLASGTTKRKKKTQKELKEDYINCVFGLAVFFCANIFNISLKIKEIVLSGYTQRGNTNIEEVKDEYVYSIKFLRGDFEANKMKHIKTPLDFCLGFENRINVTSTFGLKKIIPFEKTE